MSQTVILDNLSHFLEHMKKEHLAELEEQLNRHILFLEYIQDEHPDHLDAEKLKCSAAALRIREQQKELEAHIEKLQQLLESGHCFGFSLTRGAMRFIGKLGWWQEALIAIANWDQESDSLQQEIKLSGASSSKQTLKNIFTRALNYIVLSHASKGAELLFPDITT